MYHDASDPPAPPPPKVDIARSGWPVRLSTTPSIDFTANRTKPSPPQYRQLHAFLQPASLARGRYRGR